MKLFSSPLRPLCYLTSALVFLLSGYASATDISQTPMAVKSRAKPAFLFAVDDSGSMDSEVMLPSNDGAAWWHTGDHSFTGRNATNAVQAGTINYNQAGGADGTWKKYVYLFPNGQSTTDGRRIYGDSDNDHYAVPPTIEFAWLRSSRYNPIYYDPTQTYLPWQPSHDGTATVTYANVPTTGNASAPTHPAKSPTANALELISTINSGTEGFLFRIHQGMVWTTTGATCFTNANVTGAVACDSPATASYYAQIPYYPATYYVVDSTCTAADCPFGPDGITRLKKVEILSTTTSYNCGTGCTPRTYAQELQNFANWFSYYRKRRLLLNAAFGQALLGITNLRVGSVLFNSLPTTVIMRDLSVANDKEKFLHGIYTMNTTGGTPTRSALNKLGELFDTQTGANAPILYACQYNAGFVLTDGFANVDLPTHQPGNVDGQGVSATYPYGGVAPYSDSFSNTLADYAMHYYTTRLRTDLAAGGVPVDPTDTSAQADRNANLHMNTYALTMGALGTIYGVNLGQTSNPYTNPPTWPEPNQNRNPTAVDDLFHSTINGRGAMFSARNVNELAAGIRDAINQVFARLGAAAAGTVQNPNVTSSENDYFESSYNSGNWTGELVARELDPTTGNISTTTQWQAQALLDARTASNRMIVTYSGSGGIGFNTTDLSANLGTFASPVTPPGPSDGADVINYLRGDRSLEGSPYRTRASLLGDIINAEPVIIRRPFLNYADNGYGTFKSDNSSRTRIVLQGANDGMLHAFHADTGAEEWAYVPRLLWNNLKYLTSRQDFDHRYFVDATPTYGDVDFRQTNGMSGNPAPVWRTIAIGGLGAGGRGYYALNLTSTTATTETGANSVASKVLWEFPTPAISSAIANNIGLSYGKPVITKLANGNWVVVVTSGYNNGTDTSGDGIGRLYVLNPRTGEIISTLSTGVGSAADPSGLGPVAVYVENADVDNTAVAAYAGDLKGNIWRFNLNTSTVTRIATLVDALGLAQPITAVPELTAVTVNGTKKHVLIIGTGKYLGDTDIPGAVGANYEATQTQSVYVLFVDPTTPTTITPLRSNLAAQTVTAAGNTLTATSASVSLCGASSVDGWYADLPITGQRVVTDISLARRVAAITVNLPSNEVCSPGGHSWYMEMSYAAAGGGCTITVTTAFQDLGNALASRVVIAQLSTGGIIGLIRKSDTSTVKKDLAGPGGGSTTKRMSWRELIAK